MSDPECELPNLSLSPGTESGGRTRTIDSAKKLLLWLFQTRSPRLTLHLNTKGKNRHVWRQFRIAYIDDVEQPYAMCSDCDTFVKYSGRTGTGGLVRHHCYRQILAKYERSDELEHKQAQLAKGVDALGHARQDIEQLIRSNSDRIGFMPNYKGKSDVWAQFDIITLDEQVINFAACKLCRSIVTYVSRTGTGGMTRHKCQRPKRALTPEHSNTPEDLAPMVKQEVSDYPEQPASPPPTQPSLAELQLKAFSQLLQANLQTMSSKREPRSPPQEPPRESAQDEVRRHYVKLLRRSLDTFHAMRNDAFFDLAQTLVNVGAEYGKIDVREILLEAADLNAVFESD